MSNIAIVYESKAGHTEQYAKWIKEAVGEADILNIQNIKSAEKLLGYDFILFGSGIYNEKIGIANFIKKNSKTLKFKKFAMFAVGSSEGTPEYRDALKAKNFPEDMRRFRMFQLRGGITLSKLGMMDKLAMTAQQAKLMSKDNKTNEDLMILGMFESQKDFTAKENIAPIVEYITLGGWKLGN